MKLSKPYWIHKSGLPSHDFNKEIVEPGINSKFPDGAVGIRVDDDFWTVAALPLEKFRKIPIEEIVAQLWPDIKDAGFNPDVIVTKDGQ